MFPLNAALAEMAERNEEQLSSRGSRVSSCLARHLVVSQLDGFLTVHVMPCYVITIYV